jgi:hypothetical protein
MGLNDACFILVYFSFSLMFFRDLLFRQRSSLLSKSDFYSEFFLFRPAIYNREKISAFFFLDDFCYNNESNNICISDNFSF